MSWTTERENRQGTGEESKNLQEIQKQFYSAGIEGHPEDRRKVISRKHLINTLNYINFQDGVVHINLKHKKYKKVVSLKTRPQPCLNNILECRWTETKGLKQRLRAYEYQNLFFTDGHDLIMVNARLKSIGEEGIKLELPDQCYEITSRKVKRYSCEGIKVQLIQNGVVFHGSLPNFSALSFPVEISTLQNQSFQWVNPESSVIVVFRDGEEVLYSAECRIARQTCSQRTRTFILKPLKTRMQRFKPKKYRSLRQRLSPSPNVIFKHPFTKKMTRLKVYDLSGSGLSVEEYDDNSVLLPGMIIPELDMEFLGSSVFRCRAQVIYRVEGESGSVRCGLAILDMDIRAQIRLSGILHQTNDRNSYVCNRVDPDALWDFFFRTGFVYPEKYAFMHANKEKFREVYERLYDQNPEIARHFIYQDRNIIYGHISMVRFYENTWIIHHHAADRSSHNNAGLVVLEQVGHYLNDFHRIYSAHMDFVACYFRPDNRFPNRIFGGVARSLNDPKGSSLDSFAYFHHHGSSGPKELPPSWRLASTLPEDLHDLEGFYENESGGLMLDALDLTPDMIDITGLNREYHRLGFKRERHLFSLKRDGSLAAIIMVNVSDVGLNMSDLTNCIHLIVLDPNNLSSDVVSLALSRLSGYYDHDKIPVLLYPLSYAKDQSISYDKIYNLWVLNTRYGDDYFRYVGNLLHRLKYS